MTSAAKGNWTDTGRTGGGVPGVEGRTTLQQSPRPIRAGVAVQKRWSTDAEVEAAVGRLGPDKSDALYRQFLHDLEELRLDRRTWAGSRGSR